MMAFSVVLYLRCPATVSHGIDTIYSARGVLAEVAVLAVLLLRYVTQVQDRVVKWIPVNVVYYTSRPRPIKVEPSKSMSRVGMPKNAYMPVAKRRFLTCYCSDSCGPMSRSANDEPSEHARQWVVIQKLTQTFCGNFRHVRDVFQVLFRSIFYRIFWSKL